MSTFQVNWKQNTKQYARGSWCYLGKVVVAQTSRALGLKSDQLSEPLWTVKMFLPGIKEQLDRYQTEDEAKSRCEYLVKVWLRWIKDTQE